MKTVRVFLLIGLLCCLVSLAAPVAASSDIRLEARVRRLESEVMRLRSQVASQRSGGSGSSAAPVVTSSPSLDDPSLEDQFDNLAILTIELKQQVRALTERVSQLEGTVVE